MRAADAAEKVTRKARELLQPYKKELLGLMAESNEQELCWHLAAMVPRLSLTPKERQRAALLLGAYLEHRSSIVKTFALQGLAELAQQDASLRATVVETLRKAVRKGTPAMKARSRKLLLQFVRDRPFRKLVLLKSATRAAEHLLHCRHRAQDLLAHLRGRAGLRRLVRMGSADSGATSGEDICDAASGILHAAHGG